MAALLAYPALAAGPALAQGGVGDLTVTPTRVVFEGRARTAQLSLINRGTAPATFRIAFTRLRMSEAGSFEEVAEPVAGERFADSLVRFSPRQVTLEPGVAQTVRLMLRKPAELEPGEYRSHLVLHAVPDEEVGRSIEESALEEEEFRIALVPIFRISVPVIVRHGEALEAVAELSELDYQPAANETPPAVSLRLDRRGARSIYGDVSVVWVPDRGTPTVVGLIKGLAVYAPNSSRRLELPLRVPDGVELSGGRLRVAFSEEPGAHGGTEAEAELPVS